MERVVCDYIAGMTDQYSMERFEEIYIPSPGICKERNEHVLPRRN